jgi:transcriptional regulator with PAS, ATPase and Fis domain
MFLNNTYKIIQKIQDFSCVLDSKGIIKATNAKLANSAELDGKNIVDKNFAEVLQLSKRTTFFEELIATKEELSERFHSDYSALFNTHVNISLVEGILQNT